MWMLGVYTCQTGARGSLQKVTGAMEGLVLAGVGQISMLGRITLKYTEDHFSLIE
jgi:hypothetical protein